MRILCCQELINIIVYTFKSKSEIMTFFSSKLLNNQEFDSEFKVPRNYFLPKKWQILDNQLNDYKFALKLIRNMNIFSLWIN